MLKSRFIPAAVLMSVCAWVGVAQTRASIPKGSGAKATTQSRMSDAQIEAAIRARLAKSPKLGPEKFQVHVQGGVATIEGKTDVVQHKGTATRMAKAAGALAVNNHIQVSDAARQKAASNLETGRRRVQVKRGEDRNDSRGDGRQPPPVRNR